MSLIITTQGEETLNGKMFLLTELFNLVSASAMTCRANCRVLQIYARASSQSMMGRDGSPAGMLLQGRRVE
ncbi:hypothetical protein E2C01_005080 [Portunus trituberculatus]|uniref:Uncharacterized protein n=1 Tax=Portunus trituberculatus TaxID=210409 RepID=A0A5B7CSE0_PORTR|nr:hypothetical protein [Portunus trituberculatus]